MPGLVDNWISRVSKLRCRKRSSGAAASSNSNSQEEEGEEGKGMVFSTKLRRSITLSETTVIMLMDRFAPS